MLGENKNLKNSIKDTSSTPVSYEDNSFRLASYTKTNKLITALYMVTDVMDKEEPLRNKLRTLGINIVSDTNSLPKAPFSKIDEILSLLDIAFTIGMISEMNCNILKKEFIILKQSIQEFDQIQLLGKNVSLLDFLKDNLNSIENKDKGHELDVRYTPNKLQNRIGIQKGSTLLKALSKIEISNKNNHTRSYESSRGASFDILKKQRREDILKTLKNKPSGVSIKDIAFALHSLGEEWGEKTLQRELVSMVCDGVLHKTGEKRWSRYFI